MDDEFGWVIGLILLPLVLMVGAIVGIAWCFYKFLQWVWRSPKRITIFWGVVCSLIAGIMVSIAIGNLLTKIGGIHPDRISEVSLSIGIISAFVTLCLYFKYMASYIYRTTIGQNTHDLALGYNRYGEIE